MTDAGNVFMTALAISAASIPLAEASDAGDLLIDSLLGMAGMHYYLPFEQTLRISATPARSSSPDEDGNYSFTARMENTHSGPIDCWGWLHFDVQLGSEELTYTYPDKWRAHLDKDQVVTVRLNVPVRGNASYEKVNYVEFNEKMTGFYCKPASEGGVQ